MESQTIYCNNCGNEGHLYRHCRLPVLSYGVLCIDKDKVLKAADDHNLKMKKKFADYLHLI